MDWSQLRTILWLRWRLTRNQWSRGGAINAALSMIGIVIMFMIAAIGGLAGLLIGAFALDTMTPNKMLIMWDVIIGVFLFIWMISLFGEIQRSETIDIGKLLHMPVSLKSIFFINYIASHVIFGIIVFVPVMLGLCLGLTLGRSLIMILMLPLVISFIFMITAWTYCLRGWLVTLMINPRRRRTVIAIVTFTFIIIFQLPNLFGQVFSHGKRHRPRTTVSSQPGEQTVNNLKSVDEDVKEGLLLAHKFVPFLWVGNGARALTDGSPWAALLGAAGAFGLGGLGLRRAYRTTIRFYQGTAISSKVKKKTKEEKVVTSRKNRLEESLPFVSDETSALALAFFQSLRRATEVKMMLATNFFMLLFFSTMFFLRHSENAGDNIKSFIVTGAITVSFFGLIQIMFNQFGFDRGGFRTIVLSPVPRKYILYGKNLAFMPVALCIGTLLILVITFFLQMSPISFLAAILQLITAYLLMCITGNLASILNPYRIGIGSMKPTKTSTTTTLMLFLSHLFFPFIMIPILIPPIIGLLLSKAASMSPGPFNFLFSMILLLVIFFFYRFSLKPLGGLLQKREKKILQIVSREIE